MAVSPEDLVDGSVKLSSLPEIYYRLNEVINHPNSSFADIADVISYDTSLSARLMQIVNSAYYSFPSTIETITQAISIIGSQQLRDLALATTIQTFFKGISRDLVSINSFWRHSVTCGIAARTIAIQRRESNPEKYFLAGILHDIGRLVIYENIPEEARTIMGKFKESDELLHNIEKELLGFDHARVGMALMEAWKLPRYLQNAVGYHHSPDKAKSNIVDCSIVHLADVFTKSMEIGSSGDPYIPPVEPQAWEEVGISTSQLPSIWKKIEKQYNETVQIILIN